MQKALKEVQVLFQLSVREEGKKPPQVYFIIFIWIYFAFLIN